MLRHTFSEVTVKCFFNLHIRWVTGVNPLSANSDQQFSPNNIHTLSRDKVMRINKMITIEKMLWSFIKFSQLIVKGDVWRSVWRICMWILGLKGLIRKKSPFARKSKKKLEILDSDSRDWIPGSLSVELGFRIPIASGRPYSGFQRPRFQVAPAKFPDPAFQMQKFPGLRDPKFPYKGRKESITWQIKR